MSWTQEQAIALCREVEAVCPTYGCHVALTGGTLYKDGERKDLDLLFYRIRQQATVNVDDLFDALLFDVGIVPVERFGWVVKAKCDGKSIDCLFPEASLSKSRRIKASSQSSNY